MKHKIKYLTTTHRITEFQGYVASCIEDASTYRGCKIIVSYTETGPEDMCIEVEMRDARAIADGRADMDGFDTVKEATLWIDAQLDDVADDVEGDWFAYREEHSLRSYQLI